MSDKEILEIFILSNGAVNNGKTETKWLRAHPEIYSYLINRFEDTKEKVITGELSIAWVVKRIQLHKEILDECQNPNCHNILYRLDAKYCSTYCRNTDLKMIAQQKQTTKKHVDENPNYWKDRSDKATKTLAKNHPDDPTCGRFGSKLHNKVMIEKYGDKYYHDSEKQKETLKQLVKENPNYYKEIHEKASKTYFEKTGYEWNSKNPEDRKRAKETAHKNNPKDPYNSKQGAITKFLNNPSDPCNSKRANKTKLEHNGAFFPKRVYEITNEVFTKFHLNENLKETIIMDSTWEVIYYLYMKLHGYNIIRNKKGFDYGLGTYFPDFVIDNSIYIEIKPSHCLDKEGNLIYCSYMQGNCEAQKLQAKSAKMKEIALVVTEKEILNRQLIFVMRQGDFTTKTACMNYLYSLKKKI